MVFGHGQPFKKKGLRVARKKNIELDKVPLK